MIIRKPTKIELKPEDDFEEYEQYKQEQQEQLNKYNKNQENGIGQFSSEFGINMLGSNRLFNQPYSLGGPNDRSFIGDSYQSAFQGGIQSDMNYRYINNTSISGSSINNFSSNNQASFDRSQTGNNSSEGGQFNQLFSALIGGQGFGARPPHTGSGQQNPNPQGSLNNSN